MKRRNFILVRKISHFIEASIIGTVEFLAVYFPSCGISYIETDEAKGYQGINIRWRTK